MPPSWYVFPQQTYEEIFLLSSQGYHHICTLWAIDNVLMQKWSVLWDEGRSKATKIPSCCQFPSYLLHLWDKHTNLIVKKCLLLSHLVLHKQPLSSGPHSHPRGRSCELSSASKEWVESRRCLCWFACSEPDCSGPKGWGKLHADRVISRRGQAHSKVCGFATVIPLQPADTPSPWRWNGKWPPCSFPRSCWQSQRPPRWGVLHQLLSED